MLEIMPFGRYRDSSVEQIALLDYKYYSWVLRNVDIKKGSLRERFDFVEYAANNFISNAHCSQCSATAEKISIYHGWNQIITSSLRYIYCSTECYKTDPIVQTTKAQLVPLQFQTALRCNTKQDANDLVSIMATCMGMRDGRKTKRYLEEFFNNCATK